MFIMCSLWSADELQCCKQKPKIYNFFFFVDDDDVKKIFKNCEIVHKCQLVGGLIAQISNGEVPVLSDCP